MSCDIRELCGELTHLPLRVFCPLSGHRARLWQDIVHRPPPAERLVVPSRVESQCSDQFPVLGDDADVGAGDQEADLSVLVFDSDGDVAQPAEVAECDLAEGVNLVAADAVGRREPAAVKAWP